MQESCVRAFIVHGTHTGYRSIHVGFWVFSSQKQPNDVLLTCDLSHCVELVGILLIMPNKKGLNS